MFQECRISNIRVFGMPIDEKKISYLTIGSIPLILANLNPHSLKMFPTKFGWNQFSGFGEVVQRKSLRTDDERTNNGRM